MFFSVVSVYRVVYVSEGIQEPRFSKRSIEKLFLLVRETGVSLPPLLPFSPQPPCSSPWGFSTMARAEAASQREAPWSWPLRFPFSTILLFACGPYVPLSESHVAFRKNLAHGVDRTLLACLARSRPKQERAPEKSTCLFLFSPPRPRPDRRRIVFYDFGYSELGNHLEP